MRHAQRSCRDEQRLDPAAFRERYGTNRNKRNAFGKCISQRAKEQRGQDGYKPSKPRKRSKKRR